MTLFDPNAPLPVHPAYEAAEGHIPTWSHSALSTFKRCPFQLYLAKIRKVEQGPSHPAAARGIKIHDALDMYVQGKTEKLIKDVKNFREDLKKLRREFKLGLIETEGKWGLDRAWAPCTWEDEQLWGKVIIDVLRREDNHARIIDYKTGKSRYNEVSHGTQMLRYGLATAMRYPDIDLFTTELWYLDENRRVTKEFSRSQLMVFLPGQTEKALELTECRVFIPKPDDFSCKWCNVSPHCTARLK